MEVARPKRGIRENEYESGFEKQAPGQAIEDVWTRFFYKKNLLRFQVLLQTNNGEIVLYQELKDYSEYINTLNDLRKARMSNAVMKDFQ